MSFGSVRSAFLGAALVVFLASCGSGRDVASGGTGGTGISYGPITDFGSVYVNGVKFDTTNTNFTEEDSSSITQNDLAIGMVVRVEGRFDDPISGTAFKISYEDDVEGPIGRITPAGQGSRTFQVLGWTVIADANTCFESAGSDSNTCTDDGNTADNLAELGALADGNVVEVSGLINENGDVQATYIEKKSESPEPGQDFEVKGVISELDATSGTFRIKGLVVHCSQATDIGDLPDGLADGLYVQVHGEFVDSDFTATQIEHEDEDDIAAGDGMQVEVEGYVTEVTGTSFKVGQQAVQTTPTTQVEPNGSTITLGKRVEVEGWMSGNVLTAKEVEVK
jgi:hypothetical protein